MKKIIKRIPIIAILFSLFISIAIASESFVIRDIKIIGLQGISYGTVISYLPVRVGDTLTSENTGELIRDLYNTGFFQNVELSRQGNVLVIQVVERPTLNSIVVNGNTEIKKDKLSDILKSQGLIQGHVFDNSSLERVTQELKQEYNSLGKYNTHVDASVKELSRNRVSVTISVSEGGATKIKEIKIIGNKVFGTSTLLRQFELTTPGLFTFFTHKDQYSKEKLEASLEALRSYYMDRGYIRFQVDSTQVSLTPDKKHVYITVKVTEGNRYTLKGYDFSGNLILSKQQLTDIVKLKNGSIFSRKEIAEAVQGIGEALGDLGYGFPDIGVNPDINDAERKVFVHFTIQPGRQVYIRRINFSGNRKTADYVLRRAVRQPEGSLLSLKKIKESQRQLRILGYLKDVQMKTLPVPDTNNQVDLEYQVEEQRSAEANFSVGYGTAGPIVGISVDQKNFLGTGRNVGIAFQQDRWAQSYNFSYYNPYFTSSGIGQGVNLYFQRTTPSRQGVSRYATNMAGGALNYDIPYSDNSRFNFNIGYQLLDLTTIGTPAPSQLTAFVASNGRVYREGRIGFSWNYNGYDQYPMPNQGLGQDASILFATPAGTKALNYYKMTYTGHLFLPLFKGFILSAHTNLGYGSDYTGKNGLPFFENFYAGGLGTVGGLVRGYDVYSLGPQDSTGKPFGGNALVSGSVGLILPYPLSRSTFRTTVFVDAGNVYYNSGPAAFGGTGSGPMRFSAGVSVEWNAFFPITISIGKALNPQPGDDYSLIPQFTIGLSV